MLFKRGIKCMIAWLWREGVIVSLWSWEVGPQHIFSSKAPKFLMAPLYLDNYYYGVT